MAEKQSYQDFLRENLTDRVKQRAYFDQIRESDTRFHGLDEKTQANILADVSGFEPFRRFAQGGVSQALDAAGNFVTNAAMDFRPADVGHIPQAVTQLVSGGSQLATSSPAMEKPVSGYTGDATYGLSKMLGASDSTAQAFRTGGEQLPNVAAQMGMMVGGAALAPVTGGASLAAIPASFGSMYGQGLDQAYSQGEFGTRAHVAASVGPLVSLATMGAARPLSAFAANRVMSMGASEAIRDGMKLGGEVGLKSVLASQAVDKVTKVALKAGQEAIVEGAQAGMGVAGDIAQNAILDPKTFFDETIKSKEYWIPMLMSEVVEGAGGTVAGRLRNPIAEAPERTQAAAAETARATTFEQNGEFKLNNELPADPVAPRTPEEQVAYDAAQLELPLYDANVKVTNDVDPMLPDSDNALVNSVKMDQQAASGVMAETIADAKSAKVNPDYKPELPESDVNSPVITAEEPTLVRDTVHVLDTVARSMTQQNTLDLHENPATRANEVVQNALENLPEGVTPDQVVSNVMENSVEVSGKWFKDHHVETDENSHIALRNPGTAELGVLLHFVRNGQVMNKGSEEVGSKLILKPNDMLTLDPVASRADYQQRAGLDITDAEWGKVVELSNAVKQQHAQIPVGVSFGEGHDPVYVQGMTDFLNRSGIQQALTATGQKLRFGIEAYKINQDTLRNSPLDYFFSMDKATNTRVGDIHYISRNRGFDKSTDPHELGHTVGDLIREGAFGPEHAVEFESFLKQAKNFTDDGKIASSGVSLASKITGKDFNQELTDLTREAYRKDVQEIAAQTFQGYFLGEKNKMSKWVKENFPRLHKLFTDMMNALTYKKDANTIAEAIHKYSPEYQQGEAIIAGILNSQYREGNATARRLKDFIRTHKLQGKAVDALTSAWYSKITHEAHTTLTDTVKTWKEGLYDTAKPSEGEVRDLADTLAQITAFYRINTRGHLPAGEASLGMPWMRKLAGGNLENIYTSIASKIEDPKLLSKLNEVFLTPKEREFLKNNINEIKDKKVMRHAGILLRNKELIQLNAQHVTAAIDELLAQSGENRVSGSQVVKQMFQIDNVVKKWMLGKLEGQNGVPFFDQNGHLMATELNKTMRDKVGKAHTFHRWFPLLSKEFKKAISRGKQVQQGYVSENGEVFLERKGGKNQKRKVFTDELDAMEYRDGLAQQAIFGDYQLKIKPETDRRTGATKYYVRAEKVERDSRYVDEMIDVDSWRNEMMGLVRAPKATEEIMPDPVSDLEAMEIARKEDFARQHGPEIMQSLQDTIPSSIRYMSERGYLNEAITAKEKKFASWLQESQHNQMLLGKMAGELGLKENALPIEVVEAWLKLQLDPGKSQQKKEAISALNRLSPRMENFDAGLNDYIMSMTNFAKSYTRARINRSLSTLEKPQVRNQVPDISPNEINGEARLANISIMNDKDVMSGVAAAIASTPGGFMGRKRAIEQTESALRTIIGRPLGVVQKLHLLIGAGPIHHSLTDPAAAQLGQFIYEETGRASAWVQETFEPLFGEGKLETDINGNDLWVNKPRFQKDEKSAIYQIESDPKLKAVSQEIHFLEQEASMTFQRLLRGDKQDMVDAEGKPVDNAPLVERAKEIASKMTEQEFNLHREALARRYTGQLTRVRREAEMDNLNQIASFALGLNSQARFENRATEAHDYAKRFSEMPIEQKVLSLVNDINMLPEDALDIAEKFTKTEDALKKKHQYMFDHPEYITETRMKDYHVGVVFKANKDGSVPAPGYYDFDTPEEAYAFIDEQRKLGNKVPNAPKDFARQRWNYKPISGSLDEIINRVTQERRDLVSTLLYKKIDNETLDKIVNVMTQLPTDISTENDVVLASKNDMVRRKFVAGRETLDMVEQFRKSTQRRSAALSRKRTDILFKLYQNDEALVKNPELFNIMDSFREGVRKKDTDAQKVIGQAGFVAYIMGNISSALVEVFQFPITMSPILMEHGASVKDAYVIPSKMMKLATHAAMRRLKSKSAESVWTGEHLDVINEAERQGRLNQRKHHDVLDLQGDKLKDALDMLDSSAGEVGVKKRAMHLGSLTFNFLNDTYGFFNRINAELSLVSAYEVLKKTQYGTKARLNEMQIKELQNRAMQVGDVANGSLQRLGRPSMFNTDRKGQRNAASMYWSLQSFVNAQVANQLRFMQKSVNVDGKFTKAESVQARKAMVGLLGAQFMGMGIMGFTLMPAMAKLVQETLGFDLEDELRDLLYNDEGKTVSEKTFMGEVASNGLLTALGVPIDYGTRISIGGIGPLSGFHGIDANQVGGPLIGLVTNAFKDMAKVQAGNMSLGESAVNLLPMGLRRGVRMSFFDDGSIYDTNKRFMFQASGVEKFGSWLGFSTLRAKQEMKARMERDEATRGDSSDKSRLANQILQAQLENPTRVQQMLLDGADKFSMKPYEFAAYVAGKQVDKKLGPTPREGAGPESVQAKKLYPSPLETPSQEQRQMEIYKSLGGLGVAPRVSRTALSNARQLDYMMRLDPTMTRGTAGHQMRENPRGRQGFSQLLDTGF